MSVQQKLKFLQVNLNRCKAAQDLMFQTTKELGIDIILGQEPNRSKSKNLLCDINCDTFIYTNKQMAVKYIHKDIGFVSVECTKLALISCYFSPNKDLEQYKDFLKRLQTYICNIKNKIIVIGGDFNAHFTHGNTLASDERGRIFDQWAAVCGLVLVNEGDTPTFSGPQGTSIIDATLTSERHINYIKNWTVQEDYENLSDHNNILFEVNCTTDTMNRPEMRGWKVTPALLNNINLKPHDMIWDHNTDKNITSAETLVRALTDTCNNNFPAKTYKGPKRTPAYWWNDEVSEKRKECIKCRRKLTRINKTKKTDAEKSLTKEEYRTSRNKLKTAINQSKELTWKKLCADLENDPWGKAYKLIAKKFNTLPKFKLTDEEIQKQINLLFPQDKKEVWKQRKAERIIRFSEEELKYVLKKIKNGKSSGPDNIPPEIIKIVYNKKFNTVLNVYNDCLDKGIFPDIWKIARLVLLEKPKKDTAAETTYRPICLLDVAGKILEGLIKKRLEEELEEKQIIHTHQFGFRANRSTLNCLDKVLEVPKKLKTFAPRKQGFCVIALFDIKNAFNSASWKHIIKALVKANISNYLINIIHSYLSDRYIITSNGKKVPVTRGVPQGSVLGPTLWNILYNDVLNLDVGSDVTLVAYADDLAAVVKSKTPEDLKEKTERTIELIEMKLQELGLEMAPAKTEIIIMVGRRKLSSISIDIKGERISSKTEGKYMGVVLGKEVNFSTHLKVSCARAVTDIKTLGRLMSSVTGPAFKKRKLIMTAVTSRLLYGAPIWGDILKYKKYVNIIESTNRLMAIRITAAYRTVSLVAILALAQLPPLELKIREKQKIFKHGNKYKAEAREELIEEWEKRWETYEGWTKTFIPNLRSWLACTYVEHNYHTTQMLTGHGTFGSYLHRIGKLEKPNCWFCDENVDTPEHTLFHCPAWKQQRVRMENEYGKPVTKNNISMVLLESKESYRAVMKEVEGIMRGKEAEERRKKSRI